MYTPRKEKEAVHWRSSAAVTTGRPLGRASLAAGWRLLAMGREFALNVAQLLPVAAFLFVSMVPAESLAFVEQVELSHRPLLFVRDSGLADTAIVGIEAFPRQRTVGALLASRSAQLPQASLLLEEGLGVRVVATAYSSTVDQTDGDPFTTAAGNRVHPGTLAANFLPFGTRVRIGDTIYRVEDRLNERYNGTYIVDIWQPDRETALQFGVRVVEMEIVSLP